jgi:hypothetical protein
LEEKPDKKEEGILYLFLRKHKKKNTIQDERIYCIFRWPVRSRRRFAWLSA